MALALVATLGPASFGLAAEIVRAGATSLRLNASHMSPEAVGAAIERARRVTDVPIVVDLQGAKMRLGSFAERAIARGERVVLGAGAHAIPLPHAELVAGARAGDTLSLDDDRVRLRVEAATAGGLEASVLVGDVLRPNKGICVVERAVEVADLGARDQAHVEAARGFPAVSFAVSFMTDGHESAWVRDRAPGCLVVGKVERQVAIDALDAIEARVDAVWICRGDLGAQLGVVALARWLSGYRPATRVPVLLAGQVLEHLTEHATPTRSEVCHLADVLGRGYAGVVLTDETAIGRDPVNAVRTAAELLRGLSRG